MNALLLAVIFYSSRRRTSIQLNNAVQKSVSRRRRSIKLKRTLYSLYTRSNNTRRRAFTLELKNKNKICSRDLENVNEFILFETFISGWKGRKEGRYKTFPCLSFPLEYYYNPYAFNRPVFFYGENPPNSLHYQCTIIIVVVVHFIFISFCCAM